MVEPFATLQSRIGDAPASSRADLQALVEQLREEIVRIRHRAHHDTLTGLPNRALLKDRLHQATHQAARQGKTIGLLFLDIDHFKSINDHLGHCAGDQLLQQVADRLQSSIRGCDTVCRYGGDEFIVMLPEIDLPLQTQQMRAVVRKLRARLAVPYPLSRQELRVRVSIGAAVLTPGRNSCDELIDAADAAMYRSRTRRTARPMPVTAAQG